MCVCFLAVAVVVAVLVVDSRLFADDDVQSLVFMQCRSPQL